MTSTLTRHDGYMLNPQKNSGPGWCVNTNRSLTHHFDLSEGGLASC